MELLIVTTLIILILINIMLVLIKKINITIEKYYIDEDTLRKLAEKNINIRKLLKELDIDIEEVKKYSK